jgi:hypothetical protein
VRIHEIREMLAAARVAVRFGGARATASGTIAPLAPRVVGIGGSQCFISRPVSAAFSTSHSESGEAPAASGDLELASAVPAGSSGGW